MKVWKDAGHHDIMNKVRKAVPQSCPTLCDPMDHGILQARILEWVPIPSPADLLDPGIEPGSPALQAEPEIVKLPPLFL